MTTVDANHFIFECEVITDYIKDCRKNHKKIDPKFIFTKGKDIMDYANQCYCLSNKKIPICGIYNIVG